MIWIPSSSHFQFNQLVAETAEVYLQNRTNAKPNHPVWQPEKKSRSSRHKCMLVLTCVRCVGAIFRVDTRDRILSQSPTTTKQYYHRMTSHTVCVCACCEQTGLYSSVVPLRHVNSWASGFMTNPRWHYWLEVSDGGKSFKIDGILRTLTVFLLLQASVIILESVSPSCYLSYQLKLTWAG